MEISLADIEILKVIEAGKGIDEAVELDLECLNEALKKLNVKIDESVMVIRLRGHIPI